MAAVKSERHVPINIVTGDIYDKYGIGLIDATLRTISRCYQENIMGVAL